VEITGMNCKKLKSKTFSNKEVGDFFNSSFVNASLDGEEQEGSELAVKYGVQGYPTLLFINGDGNVVERASGYHNANELIRLGKTAINRVSK
jgi:thioredoxin-related protein